MIVSTFTIVDPYRIGGCQSLNKGLGDCSPLSLFDGLSQTCCPIVSANRRTIENQEEFNELYPDGEKDLVTIQAE